MELIFFAVAFACGFAAYQVKLPPMVGFLLAGFVLHGAGYKTTELLNNIADLGITLLLFSIGLKLKVSSLMKVQVWAPASAHIVISTALFGGFLLLLGAMTLPLFVELNWQTALLLGFAFSFSSTVFAVKVLEDRGEMASLHGKISIGILVMQDIFAVLFLVASTGKLPNYWALALLVLLPLMRPVMFWVLNRSKHGELLPLFGFFFALVAGYQAFEFAGIKGDLGALILGMMFASHKKAGELAKSLLSFKDILLVGFFLTIGLNAELTFNAVIAALLIVAVLGIKVALYYVLTNAAKLRARTSLLSAFTLANYKEIFTDPTWYWGYINSIIYVSLNTVISVCVALPAAYAFSRYRFLGDKHLFFWLLTNRMAPAAVFALPFFQLYSAVGLFDTYLAVALAHCLFNIPLAVWILEGFMSGVPKELDETAYVDGYSFPAFFTRIFLPSIKAGVGVTAFFCFMFSWVELLLAKTLTAVEAKPIAAVMTRTASSAGYELGLLAAAGTLTIIPGAIVIYFVRNYIAKGFALGRV